MRKPSVPSNNLRSDTPHDLRRLVFPPFDETGPFFGGSRTLSCIDSSGSAGLLDKLRPADDLDEPDAQSAAASSASRQFPELRRWRLPAASLTASALTGNDPFGSQRHGVCAVSFQQPDQVRAAVHMLGQSGDRGRSCPGQKSARRRRLCPPVLPCPACSTQLTRAIAMGSVSQSLSVGLPAILPGALRLAAASGASPAPCVGMIPAGRAPVRHDMVAAQAHRWSYWVRPDRGRYECSGAGSKGEDSCWELQSCIRSGSRPNACNREEG